jgi:TRAP-type transport system periplasmic protein
VSSTIEEFGFFEVPYLFRDRDHLRRVADEIFWPEIAPFAERKGFKILGLWEHGFRQVTNNARPIVVPSDLSGIKLRTPSGFWRIKAFQAFEANPTAMPLTEVFVAIQTGVIDGQENPMHQIYSSRFHEVQDYLSMTNHIYSPIFLTVGAEKWATHPPEIRAEIERIARDVQEFSYREGERMDIELRQLFEEHGIEVNEIDRPAFVQASRSVYEEFGRMIPGGERWIEEALALESEVPVAVPADVSPPQLDSADARAE